MTAFAGRTYLAVLLAALGLSACSEGQNPLGFVSRKAAATPATQVATSTRLIERDVEAPEVFQATANGLWDGRPALGGVWVAYPELTSPERVLIRNNATGKFVIGALYRRDDARTGPPFQVSSEAAEALGMLAGQAHELNVTALRREEVPAETAEAAAAPVGDGLSAPVEDVATVSLDGPAAAGHDNGEAHANATGGTPRPVAAPPGEPAARLAVQGPPIVEPVPASASTTIDTSEGNGRVTITPRAATAPVRASLPAGVLDKPFIQIGLFSVEENARNTATSLRANGIVPEVRAQTSSGKRFWRVLVGPATSRSERGTLLAKVRDLGFEDAYFVTN